MNIYRSFEQWKNGNVLEHGVPRIEYYSEAQLDLVEMGWNYGYDAGRAVEQALDKKAEDARELGLSYDDAPAPDIADIIAGELKVSRGTAYDMMREALKEASPVEMYRNKCADGSRCLHGCHTNEPCYTTPPAPQPAPVKTYHDGKPWPVAPKPWVGLTDAEIEACDCLHVLWTGDDDQELVGTKDFARAIEAKLREKNGGAA